MSLNVSRCDSCDRGAPTGIWKPARNNGLYEFACERLWIVMLWAEEGQLNNQLLHSCCTMLCCSKLSASRGAVLCVVLLSNKCEIWLLISSTIPQVVLGLIAVLEWLMGCLFNVCSEYVLVIYTAILFIFFSQGVVRLIKKSRVRLPQLSLQSVKISKARPKYIARAV